MLLLGGSIQKALEEQFANYSDMQLMFTGDSKIEGFIKEKPYSWDFSENPARVLSLMKQDLALATADETELNNLSNDPNNDDWKEILDKQYLYHGYTHASPTFDPAKNLPRDRMGNIITNK